MTTSPDSVRIDKWLWAARFYKTRQLAIKAIKSSQVSLGKQALKPASNIRIGDHITVKRGLYTMVVEVLALSEKRGSAKVAQSLYTETVSSIAAREALRQELASQPKMDVDKRKPDKRGVRDHRAFKRQS